MGDHDTPTSSECVLRSLNSFRDGTNLVNLEKQGIASVGVNGLLDELGVGDSKIITGLVLEHPNIL